MSQSLANERLGGPLKEGSGLTPENQGWAKNLVWGECFQEICIHICIYIYISMSEKRVPPHTLKPDWRHEQRMHHKGPQQLFANKQLFRLLKHRAFIPTSWEFPQHGQSSCVLNFVFQMLKNKPSPASVNMQAPPQQHPPATPPTPTTPREQHPRTDTPRDVRHPHSKTARQAPPQQHPPVTPSAT